MRHMLDLIVRVLLLLLMPFLRWGASLYDEHVDRAYRQQSVWFEDSMGRPRPQ